MSRAAKKDTILWHIANIIDKSEENGINDEFMEKAKDDINFVSGFFDISFEQAVLFSHFVARGDDKNISQDDIAKSMKCKPFDMLFYQEDLDVLTKKKRLIIKQNRNDRISYYIPLNVFDSIKFNRPVCLPEYNKLTIYDLFDVFEELVDRCTDKAISIDDFITEINSLLDNNIHLNFSMVFKSYRLKETDSGILVFFCERFVNNDDDEIQFGQLEEMFENSAIFRRFKVTFRDRSNPLMQIGLIEHTTSGGFGDREEFKLTDKAKKELFAELNTNLTSAKLKKDLVLSGSIAKKNMFYNAREENSIRELTSLLMPETYQCITGRLKEVGMRTGFACLFYGEPGTGKTETVNMIAKTTGRDIMMVDISRTKSCWFGESEKKIKEVFSKYRTYVEVSETAPILLLNEADAIIGKRKDVTVGNVAQTENAIQNIILQELENLDGILIATTNLTQNIDKAFERRFLYKIEFKKPTPAIRETLWKEMIPELSNTDAHLLAGQFDFSGGQIENIARKRTVDFVLSGGNLTVDRLIEYCRDERLEKQTGKAIGFNR